MTIINPPNPWENLEKYHIVLGSQSPRRVELLRGLDLTFEHTPIADLDESYPEEIVPQDIARYIAEYKADAYKPLMTPETLLITADTTVIVDEHVLGKPRDDEHAAWMLHKMSGRSHQVITGVCITTETQRISFSDTTIVQFAPLTDETIEYYLQRYAPYDKAGAYGIQEWLGYRIIERIDGSFYNVMGLPVHRLAEELIRF